MQLVKTEDQFPRRCDTYQVAPNGDCIACGASEGSVCLLPRAAADLSHEAAALLRNGAADHLGLACFPGQVRKNYPALLEAEKLGYIRFLDVERPWVTEEGRAAVGAPTQAEADRQKLFLICSRARKPLAPAKRDDPRTDFDYRFWKSMRWVCTLVVRQPDCRPSQPTVRVGKTLTSEKQFLGARNSIIQPESTDRFILTLVPDWMVSPRKKHGSIEPAIFSSYQLALDETDPAFTEDERKDWDRLRHICFSINSRIRNSNRAPRRKLRYGEFA